jgi:predicted aminopeptidase
MLTETDFLQLLRIVLACLLLALLPGCYVLQAARGEMQVLDERRPIEQVITDPKTPPPVRTTLTEVSEARTFASQALGLPDNKSFRTYSDLHRDYVVWNVVATPEFSVQPVHWCFPIVGCVAYRGYFSERDARKLAAELKAHGDDVLVGGVPAYSTLGRFADPVLNTMLGYGDVELAAIVFHELAHQLVYVPGDSSFNEAFATTVEDEGVMRWLLLKGRLDELARYRAASARQLEYIALFRRRRTELERLYASDLPADEKRRRKSELFAALTADVHALEHREGVRSPYAFWLEQGLNNAHLASVATYYDCVPGFRRLLQNANGDLPRFYDLVRELARRPATERDATVCSGH